LWKYSLFKDANRLIGEGKNTRDILNDIMGSSSFKKHGNEIMKFLPKMLNARKIPNAALTQQQELSALKESLDFFTREFGCEITITDADKSSEQKAGQAMPGKAAILIQ